MTRPPASGDAAKLDVAPGGETRALVVKIGGEVVGSGEAALLAGDLRTLVDGGYRIGRVVPVDQFLFSPHIEVVAELGR